MTDKYYVIVEKFFNSLVEEYDNLTKKIVDSEQLTQNVQLAPCGTRSDQFSQFNQFNQLHEKIKNESKNIVYDFTTASIKNNNSRNRYGDVLAYEKTRFFSKNLDYINANWVDHKYILTQGPIEKHINDFWTMVLDSDANIVICLANEIENSQYKFDPYFSDDKEKIYDRIKINVESMTKYEEEHIIVRTIRISKIKYTYDRIENKSSDSTENKSSDSTENDTFYDKDSSSEHEISFQKIRKVRKVQIIETVENVKYIKHIHYTGWPDYGTPSNVSNFLQILSLTEELSEKSSNAQPIIVHCSAGIGRTGTFTVVKEVLDIVKSVLDGTKSDFDQDFNIPQQILSLRKYRQGLVQSEEQLQFCYLAIIKGIETLLSKKNSSSPFFKSLTNIIN
jgi:protein tyrosine phosphatase